MPIIFEIGIPINKPPAKPIFPSASPLPPSSPTGTSTGVTTSTHPSPGATSVVTTNQPRGRSPRSQPVVPPPMAAGKSVADLLGNNALEGPDNVAAATTHSPPAIMSPKSAKMITSPRSKK